MKRDAKDFLIVSLDVPSIEESLVVVENLGSLVDFYKVGLELFTRGGPTIVEILKKREKKVFLDLKLHDIPNTVAGAVNAAIDMEVDLLTLHTLGGFEMMEAAQKAVWKKKSEKPIMLGVTILTSLDEAFLEDVLGIEKTFNDEILDLASIAKSAGLGGVVASAEEVSLIKECCGKDFIVATPGIRLTGAKKDDQKRFTTPFDAIVNGSDYLVVGRPIIKSENMRASAEAIIKEIKDGLQETA
ncbi:orotidine-5'-phosphate decarboxylase [candidate division WOR-3 bacterium]|nr:orotidine-5'-phosphate decarboxylase [candidate division WOR-3 bacterium]